MGLLFPLLVDSHQKQVKLVFLKDLQIKFFSVQKPINQHKTTTGVPIDLNRVDHLLKCHILPNLNFVRR